MNDRHEARRERIKAIVMVLILLSIALFSLPVGLSIRKLLHLHSCCGAGS
ncbi:hypothetical protein JJB07_18065 [Tumebacillus sp. ITR2]|uniref:DUF4044 domain-containing protein n=1 Tax=Tumebacillus amylolyticus TaxID=2801339 RepID=A0ABS1JE11_9BACL|nr:hypothetical protein [Tumebacillus amylolyticus]MBL0388512.1 hypothetical protein [Tumebacillus amylolyticus]